MITYKGNKLLIGKRFIYENEVVSYQGKIYGNHHSFSKDGVEFVLTEEETSNLKEYSPILLEELDNSDDIYQLIASYTDKQLNMINNNNSNSKDLLVNLANSFQEELNNLSSNNLAYNHNYQIIDGDEDYILDVIKNYLNDVVYNVSQTSLPTHYTQLNNFIYNINRLQGDSNGTV